MFVTISKEAAVQDKRPSIIHVIRVGKGEQELLNRQRIDKVISQVGGKRSRSEYCAMVYNGITMFSDPSFVNAMVRIHDDKLGIGMVKALWNLAEDSLVVKSGGVPYRSDLVRIPAHL